MKKLTKDKISLTLLIFNILILSISIGYFSYGLILLESIETPLRIGIIVFLIILSVLFIKTIIKNTFKKKKAKTTIITIISIIIAASSACGISTDACGISTEHQRKEGEKL